MSKYSVFLSYSHKDQDIAKEIEKRLKKRKISKGSIFIDVKALKAGDKWSNEIREALEQCYICVSLFSSSYLIQVANDGQERFNEHLRQAADEDLYPKKTNTDGQVDDNQDADDAAKKWSPREWSPREWTRYESFVAHFLGKLVPFSISMVDGEGNLLNAQTEVDPPAPLSDIQFKELGIKRVHKIPKPGVEPGGDRSGFKIENKLLDEQINEIIDRVQLIHKRREKREQKDKDREKVVQLEKSVKEVRDELQKLRRRSYSKFEKTVVTAGIGSFGVLAGMAFARFIMLSDTVSPELYLNADISEISQPLMSISDNLQYLQLAPFMTNQVDPLIGEMSRSDYDLIMKGVDISLLEPMDFSCSRSQDTGSYNNFVEKHEEQFKTMENYEMEEIKINNGDSLTKVWSRVSMSVEGYRFLVFSNPKIYGKNGGYHPNCIPREEKIIFVPKLPFRRVN